MIIHRFCEWSLDWSRISPHNPLIGNSIERSQVRQRISDWFKKNARDLPWRQTEDPYKIWISEIMLQQTQVGTVIPYYEKFLKKFPSIFELAKANEAEVMKLWQGLGYYRRAKNLHQASQFLVTTSDGRFPKTRAELLEIPGIGEYSAGAILSIAHRIPSPALDGNLIRIYSRLYRISDSVQDLKTKKQLWEIAKQHTPDSKRIIREFTEGMMELGATICSPRKPQCDRCPVNEFCEARKMGDPERFPIKTKKVERLKLYENIFLIEDPDRGRIAFTKPGADPKFPDFRRLPYRSLLKEDDSRARRADFRYSVTHRDFQVWIDRPNEKEFDPAKMDWISRDEIKEILLPAIDRKILKEFLG